MPRARQLRSPIADHAARVTQLTHELARAIRRVETRASCRLAFDALLDMTGVVGRLSSAEDGLLGDYGAITDDEYEDMDNGYAAHDEVGDEFAERCLR